MKRLGRYRLRQILGRGGVGLVYEGVLQGPGGYTKPVAVKVLHRSDESLRREARIGGLLRHQHLVDVYEVGEDQGQWFCAMELCSGGSLSHHLPLPRRAVIEAGLQVCAALQYAHEALGLVHLDIKPENLLLADGIVKVADLGIARAEGFEGDGRIRGTPGHMAPEQARGGAVDARADVYALEDLLRSVEDPSLLAELLAARAEVNWRSGDLETACAALGDAERLAPSGDSIAEGAITTARALLGGALGRPE